MKIELHEAGMRIAFRVNEDQTVELVDFSAAADAADLKPLGPNGAADGKQVIAPRQFLAVNVTGENAYTVKHDGGSVSKKWHYGSHTLTDNAQGKLLCLKVDAPNGLHADYFMQTYTGIPVVRTWATVTNTSSEAMGLEYVSSFMYDGIGKNRKSKTYDHVKFLLPHNGWANEAQWQTVDAVDVGLSHMPSEGYYLPDSGNNRFHYGSRSSWSTSEHLPICAAKDEESGEIWYGQVEHSGAWEIEYGMGDGKELYICMMGPNEDADWWKQLDPGESFTTVPAAFGVALGDENEAFAALTRYRRIIRRPNEDDDKCFVVFNDYMNCLFGDPTEEKEKQIIDLAASLGCEYYCLDCGWYDAGPWWNKVGEWKESPERFPNGLKTVFDYCRSKGMRMGMWLEIEVMGTACELTNRLPDSWFVCNHGKRRIENSRYLLDFRNPEVRKYCSDVVDRLVEDYGCEYFKIDYNVVTGVGSDVNCDSRGDAMLEHYRGVYEWIREVYAKHPNLVIENCGSGAQRMDYGMLALHSLQSTSDQTDYVSNAYIAANVASAVTPEQGGMWVYPYEDEREHVIFNMVNGILLRPYISGIVWKMSEASMEILREGIAKYKDIRGDVKRMAPFFPRGMNRVNDKELAYGLRGEGKAYLSVFTIDKGTAEIDLACLKQPVKDVKVIYPSTGDCTFEMEGTKLKVTFPAKTAARLFEITL